jgi:hypothetical protein
MVPERCTCGAELPPDARFCHKCGKPQSATLLEPEPEPPPPILIAPPLEIGFRNPLAVRIGLFLSLLTFALWALLGVFIVIWMLAAGVVAVWLYARRTGEPPTTAGGARLGWITGVFIFLIALIVISITALAVSDKDFVELFMTQMRQRGAEATARQLVEALQSPGKIAAVILEMFLFCGVLPVLGGVLGAKFFGRPRPAA